MKPRIISDRNSFRSLKISHQIETYRSKILRIFRARIQQQIRLKIEQE